LISIADLVAGNQSIIDYIITVKKLATLRYNMVDDKDNNNVLSKDKDLSSESSDPSSCKRSSSDGSDPDIHNKRPKVDLDESNTITDVTKSVENTPTHYSSRSEANTVITPPSSNNEAPSQKELTTNVQEKSSETVDLAETLGLKPGSEIEVEWEIHNDDASTNKASLHWWKATLLEHDGRTTDSVAIRQLHYEARPDLGFNESSKEDVIFLGHDVLVTSKSGDWDNYPDSTHVSQMPYRRVNSNDEVFYYSEDQLEEQLNALLMGALQKNKTSWNMMPAAQQAMIAETIRKKKEQLKGVLMAENKVITSDVIKDILARTF